MTILSWIVCALEIAVGLRCAVWLYDRFLRRYVESWGDVDDWEPGPGEPQIRVVRNPRLDTLTPAWLREFNVYGVEQGSAYTTLSASLTASDIPGLLDAIDRRMPYEVPVVVRRGKSHLADEVALQARHNGWETEWQQSPSFEQSGWRLIKPTGYQPPLR